MNRFKPPIINIISTKNLPPQKRGKQVSRHNEAELLAQVTGARLCSVVAPPGYGKTNVLSRSFRHLHSLGFLVGWVSLDIQDNQFYRFMSYMLSALEKSGAIQREWQSALLETLPGDEGDNLISSLIEELSECDSDIYLIIDDLHHIRDRQIHAFIKRLLTYAPQNFHLIIGSRERLEVHFYRDIQNDQFVEIGSAQLKLNLVDTQLFFKDCCDLELSPGDIERWHRDTEGWVFPLKLASISIKQRPDFCLGDVFQKDQSISEYLSDEVLAGMSQPFAQFVMAISVLDIFCSETCGYVADMNTPSEYLAQMQAQNLFIERLSSGDEEWYQLHPFFRNYLESRIATDMPSILPTLHRRAREWFEQKNMPSYAIKHALESGDSGQLGSLLEKSCFELLLNGQYMELLAWAKLLSDEDIQARPKLCFAVAFDYILMHQFSEGRQFMSSLVDSSATRRKLGEFSDGMPVLLGMDAVFRDDVGSAQVYCQDWLVSVSSPRNTLPLLLVTGCNILSYCHLYKGDFAEALDVHITWKALPEKEIPAFGVTYSHCLQGLTYLHLGDVNNAGRWFDKAQNVAVDKLGEFSIYSSFATAFQAEIRYQQGDTRFLVEEVLPCLDAITQIGLVDSMIHSFPCVASSLYQQGRCIEANEVLDKAEALARHLDWPRLTLACLHQKLRFAIQERSTVDRQLINRRVEKISGIESELNISARFYLELIKAESHAAFGRYNDAIKQLMLFQVELDQAGFVYLGFLVKVRLAFFYAAQNDLNEAFKLLAGCLDFAGAAGLIQAFKDASYIKADLLCAFRDSSDGKRYQETLLAILGPAIIDGVSVDASTIVQDRDRLSDEFKLSGRELEILELLGLGLANKNIALSLGIGQETVKWHIKNIFGKLGVNSRVTAVQKARRLALI